MKCRSHVFIASCVFILCPAAILAVAAAADEPLAVVQKTASDEGGPQNSSAEQRNASRPLTHAHNDYLHSRPLLDALELGYCSIEADIFLVPSGELWVAHDPSQLSASRTLEGLYLQPLRTRLQQNAGSAFGENTQLLLWIDIKTEATATYLALSRLLNQYDDLFRSATPSAPPPVLAIVSGKRDWETIAADAHRLAGIDGRVGDLNSEANSSLLPFISDNWNLHFRWQGNGEMPAAENQKLQDIVGDAHRAGRRVRFWATPDDERLWQQLIDADVDLIGTDDLPRLNKFLEQRQRSASR